MLSLPDIVAGKQMKVLFTARLLHVPALQCRILAEGLLLMVRLGQAGQVSFPVARGDSEFYFV